IHHLLGLSVSCLVHDAAFLYDPSYEAAAAANQKENLLVTENFKVADKFLRPVTRREAYRADITYGTNNEFGFDYLRDNLVYDAGQLSQRPFNYAIIDEVDSILIDEARTPLIISGAVQESTELYRQLAQIAKRLVVDEDYNVDEKMKSVALTEKGQEKVVGYLQFDPWQTANFSVVHHVEAALRAEVMFKKDKDYVVREGEIVIVDEFTGRLMFGRRYSEGLHQAIEAKENVEIKEESKTLATVTLQNYFRLYKKISGMTGTALTEAEEFSKIYNLEVTAIPTNKPLIRRDLSDKIYQTEQAKFNAVVREVKERNEKGQPVLIGTVSIEKNEELSHLLELSGIEHKVLNAKNHEKEGEIITQAGRLGAVTVATNMAGRGVDIILGGNPIDPEQQKKIIELGGLHVIGTERHESRRIDNQLRGRAGRQGDPGSSQFFISLEDDLMRVFGGDRVKALMMTLKMPEDVPLEHVMVARSLEAAQRKIEGMNFDMRKHLLDYDDILNKHRQTIYRRRQEILFADNQKLREMIFGMVSAEIERVVSFHTVGDEQSNWDLKEIVEVMKTIFPCPSNLPECLDDIRKQAGGHVADVFSRDQIIKYIDELAKASYDESEKRISQTGQKINDLDLFAKIQRMVLLQSIDNYWMDHLEVIENLKGGIGLRAYGQHDPLVEYKRESYHKFNELMAAIEKQVVYTIYHMGVTENMSAPKTQEIKLNASRNEKPAPNKKNIGRNDPCPCGSGKKYKRCCGK
ncbi:MAG: preprotein translocase subunit SecA, partial [Patescibacteria group bacterium]|nr:preprotein translocase subunit SecA [Patescibacteria group bacterium]